MIDRALPLVAIGLSHREAPVDIRAPLMLSPDDVVAALAKWRVRGTSGFIVSTCQRTELYLRHAGNVNQAVADVFPGNDAQTSYALRHAWVRPGAEGARHLLRVTAGLESTALGESEIVGQVRRAIQQARDAGTMDALTHRVADVALLAGKRVRRETDLARQSPTLVSSALREVKRRLDGLAGRSVLVIGTGHMAKLALRALRRVGLRELVVTGRTPGHVAATAARNAATSGAWSQLPLLVEAADVVVCCTAASEPVLQASTVVSVCMRRAVARRRWPAFIDLAMPRAIERHDLYASHIIDLDVLARSESSEITALHREVASAESIVEDELDRLQTWWQTRRGVIGFPGASGRQIAS